MPSFAAHELIGVALAQQGPTRDTVFLWIAIGVAGIVVLFFLMRRRRP